MGQSYLYKLPGNPTFYLSRASILKVFSTKLCHGLIMRMFHNYLKVVSPSPSTYSRNTWYGMNVSPRLITSVASPKIVPPYEQNSCYVKRDNISLS
jgi:hypothetical protein